MLSLDPTGFPRTVVEVPGVVKVELTTPVEGLRRKGHRAIITVPATYAGKLNGLCGDFDGDSADDESPCSGGPPADCFVDDGSCGA
ncbi:zonadhesin-like [Lingula anatina]|uniref:Zonadhesin-like n=1 Tax=Lingula anatina TaxID=7574 RepID=A0A1S3JFR8_LINAN|nr:zonadhesin-like [Lingula anatina]|eukprot:XP_013409203.1 zonadhesin-like [Lingula anatina]